MVIEKGLVESVADKIGQYVRLSGSSELVEDLLSNNILKSSKSAQDGLEAMKLFLHFCELYGLEDVVKFDLSLARGLDYYTGIIYEAILVGKNKLLYFSLVYIHRNYNFCEYNFLLHLISLHKNCILITFILSLLHYY